RRAPDVRVGGLVHRARPHLLARPPGPHSPRARAVRRERPPHDVRPEPDDRRGRAPRRRGADARDPRRPAPGRIAALAARPRAARRDRSWYRSGHGAPRLRCSREGRHARMSETDDLPELATTPRLLELTWTDSKGLSLRFPLGEAARVTIGRGSGCELVIRDTRISRHHATIELVNGQHLLRDLGSANGTFLNGLRLTPGSAFT